MTIRPFAIRAAWDGRKLREDSSWIVSLADSQRAELADALEYFKDRMRAQGQTAQWLHGNLVPPPRHFPLPTLAPLLAQARNDLEESYGLVLFRGFPVEGHSLKDLHLMHAGFAGHLGTPRPQTVFGELVQDIRDIGQAPLIERRGSKHNRALAFHNDPSDVISFLCIKPAQSGGLSRFASSAAIHNALLESAPEHVRTLYRDLTHTYQDYLFVRTGLNERYIPRKKFYSMPTFSSEAGHFACKYSRFYIDQAQELPEVKRLTLKQAAALDALEGELANEKWHFSMQYQAGDVMFINNFVCFHARTAFTDDARDESARRHLLRVWLSVPNSRPLSPKWKQHIFFRQTGAGAIRGGLPVPTPSCD